MDKLGIDLWGLLWQAVSFGILVFLLSKFLYKPTLNTIDERAERVRRGMEDADKAHRRADESQQEYDRVLLEARRKGQETIAEAARAGEQTRQEITDQARLEASRIVQEAKGQIEAEQRQALASVRGQIVDLSIEATRRVLQEGLDSDTQHRLIKQFIAESGKSDEG
ncbi:MAG: F0F1 ATP synthase subunit B [Anaerolineae bacterium]